MSTFGRILLPLTLLLTHATPAAAQRRPLLDRDEDGVTDSADACPNTPRSLAAVDRGCAVVELAALAQLKRTSLQPYFEALEDQLANEPELDAHLSRATHAALAFEAGTDRLFEGDLVQAARAFEQASAEFEALERALVAASVPRTHSSEIPDGADEHHGREEHASLYMHLGLLLSEARRKVEGESRSVLTAASALRPGLRLSGRVEHVDAGGRYLRLEGGATVIVPVDLTPSSPLQGREVTVTGLGLAPNLGIATEIAAGGFTTIEDPKIRCTDLRIAPVQKFVAVQPSYLLQQPEAYEADGQLWLEKGMRLAIADLGCGPVTLSDGSVRTQVWTIRMRYSDRDYVEQDRILANQLLPSDQPLALPQNIDAYAPAELEVTMFTRKCKSNVCSYTTGEKRLYKVVVRDTGAYCNSLRYEREVFTLEDTDTSGFQSTFVSSFVPSKIYGADAPVTFVADAYRIVNGVSSKPALLPIKGQAPFAIHRRDFSDDDILFWSLESTHGVRGPSGVAWPRLEGTRGGRPFRYACQAPRIVRDALNVCSDPAVSFYRAPFSPYPEDMWHVVQGSLSTGSHEDFHAWDFSSKKIKDQGGAVLDAALDIRAARGGRVVALQSTSTKNCFEVAGGDEDKAKQASADGECPGNLVRVRHEDGTVALYLHFAANTVGVSLGQTVKRGEYLGQEGNTGYSKGPHLHFAVNEPSVGKTIPVLFQDEQRTCWKPEQDQRVWSNNEAP